jgi:hypothetical protein
MEEDQMSSSYYRDEIESKLTSACDDLKSSYDNTNDLPHLIKPNSGGFGHGIRLIDDEKDIQSYAQDLFTKNTDTTSKVDIISDDQMVVYQPYIVPYQRQIYRVWFLLGRVQCGVVRKVDRNTTTTTTAAEFTTGCAAAGVCSQTNNNIKSTTTHDDNLNVYLEEFDIPSDTVFDIEKKLLPLLQDAHCGSTEFLVNNNETRNYFDLNLLSTLPLSESVSYRKKVWHKTFNPWNELAKAILQSFCCTE